jgi:hypothetical protein
MSQLEKAIDNYDGAKELPFAFTETIMFSSDLDIESKVQKEIIPREQSSFGQQTVAGLVSTDTLNSRLTFYISDPRHYLDLANSYFTCDFKAVCADNANLALKGALSIGGIHSVIKTLIIKIGGTQLMRLDDYNKWYNINNLATHSEDYTDFMLGCSGDSVDTFGQYVDVHQRLTYTNLGSSYDDAGGAIDRLLTIVGGTQYLRVGDILQIGAQTLATSQFCTVTSITGADTCSVSGLRAADLNAAALGTIIIVRSLKSPTRRTIVNNGVAVGANVNAVVSQKIQWQLPVGALRFLKYFPLPYIQEVGPLEVEFEFCDAVQAILIDAPTAGDHRFGYQVSKPRFVASMLRPSDKVFKMHDMLYNSKGIWMPYLNYRHFRNRVDNASTDAVLTIQTNLSSVRHALTVMVDATRADSSGQTTQDYESQASFLKDGLTSYRFSAGGEQFPDYGPVDTAGVFSGEAWAQLMLSFNIKENTFQKCRIKPYQWQSNSSDKFILSTNFAKDESLWNGLSLKNNFLELDVRKTAGAVDLNAHTYLGYDSALLISRKDNVRVFD